MTVTESWDFIQNDRHGGSKYCRSLLFQASLWGLNYAQTVHFAGFCSILYVFQKRAKKSHGVISRYYNNRFSPKRVPAKKKTQTDKEKKKPEQTKLQSSPLPTFEWEFSLLLIIYRLWSLRGARSYSPCTCSSKKPKRPYLVAPCLVHSFFHSYRT